MRLFIEVLKLALSTLRENKVRSFLTVLGVVIGTGTIIGVGSILAGMDGAITGIIRSFGTNSAIVFKTRIGVGGNNPTPEERARKPLTYENGKDIAERCPSVERVSALLLPPQGAAGIMRVRYKGNDVYGPQVQGTEEAYMLGGQVEIQYGRFFTDNESLHRMPVAVIGSDIYKQLFGLENAIGKEILLSGHELEVVGVTAPPATALPGASDNNIYVPYFTMRKMFPNAQENLLMVEAKPDKLPAAIDELRAVLRMDRRVPFDKPDNFSVSTSDQLVDEFRQLTSMVTLVMVVLSSIGLLVGGIGVMNIMLVSVTERTREIGVRKAIGARRGDIITQFLIEAVVLTSLGGLIGMSLGWLVSTAVRFAVPSLPTAVPIWAAVLGIVVSVGIGLFFGIWPASKAARLDPVEALRYE
jgi:putative ABC transport system permease protein